MGVYTIYTVHNEQVHLQMVDGLVESPASTPTALVTAHVCDCSVLRETDLPFYHDLQWDIIINKDHNYCLCRYLSIILVVTYVLISRPDSVYTLLPPNQCHGYKQSTMTQYLIIFITLKKSFEKY